MTSHDPQMLKGVISLLLLDLVASREDYGYSLVVRLHDAGLVGLTEGTVYPALARIEQAGWVASFLVPSELGPARKYYRITAAGNAERGRLRAAFDRLADLVQTLGGRASGRKREGK